VWVTDEPAQDRLSLRVEWIDVVSFAHELEACMYWGAEKREDGSLMGWRETGGLEESVARGMMNLTQDARLLGREVTLKTVAEGFALTREHHPIEADEVDWLLPHYSSEFFRQEVYDRFREIDFEVPFERWFTNLTSKGNTGSASIYIMLDELLRSGRLESGQKILCYVPESARFSVGYALLSVVGPVR
jgi:3-oxoacyl-[acyl-carrier-protein] synthase-3